MAWRLRNKEEFYVRAGVQSINGASNRYGGRDRAPGTRLEACVIPVSICNSTVYCVADTLSVFKDLGDRISIFRVR